MLVLLAIMLQNPSIARSVPLICFGDDARQNAESQGVIDFFWLLQKTLIRKVVPGTFFGDDAREECAPDHFG